MACTYSSAHPSGVGGARQSSNRRPRAAQWLAVPGQQAVLIATALAGDSEMALRIARHQADRAARVPRLGCLELQGGDLAQAVSAQSTVQRMVLVDCLTLWWTQLLMPLRGVPATTAEQARAVQALLDALAAAPGRVVLVSNEIGQIGRAHV